MRKTGPEEADAARRVQLNVRAEDAHLLADALEHMLEAHPSAPWEVRAKVLRDRLRSAC